MPPLICNRSPNCLCSTIKSRRRPNPRALLRRGISVCALYTSWQKALRRIKPMSTTITDMSLQSMVHSISRVVVRWLYFFHPWYLGIAHPFTIPLAVSGYDLIPQAGWRRPEYDIIPAPRVSMSDWSPTNTVGHSCRVLLYDLTRSLPQRNAIHKPGMVPLTHASFRNRSVCPSQFLMQLQRSLNFFEIPLHISNSIVIQDGLTLLVQGASCLHSVGFAFER